MPRDKSKTDKRDRSPLADVEESEIDYLVQKAGVPLEQARQVIKRLRKQSLGTQEPIIDSINTTVEGDEYDDLEAKIRTRAYQIWEEAGRPHGRDLEHWFAAESEVARRPAARLSRPNDRRSTLPAVGSTVRDQNELPHNDRNEEPEAPKISHAAGLDPNAFDSPSASKFLRSVNSPPGLPLSRPLSDS